MLPSAWGQGPLMQVRLVLVLVPETGLEAGAESESEESVVLVTLTTGLVEEPAELAAVGAGHRAVLVEPIGLAAGMVSLVAEEARLVSE